MSERSNISDIAAVIGIGETDYPADYKLARAGVRNRDSYAFAASAYRRALADGGISHRDVDGLIVGPTTAYDTMAETLGLDVRWGSQADAVQAVVQAVLAISTGQAECIALVYGNDQRSAGTKYGGEGAMGVNEIRSYGFYAPWGLTSQGALYALLARRYMEETGLTSEQLAQVAVGQREFARLNPNAVFKKRLNVDHYLSGPYIVEPLRLYDYCMINDGGVAMIIASEERARNIGDGKHPLISGLARSDQNIDATSLRPRLQDFYHIGHQKASDDLWNSTGRGPADVDIALIYDSFSIHVPVALEGFGYCGGESIGKFMDANGIGPGGALPVNTSGGHLSESYMQGWNHQLEAVRQLSGRAGDRQVDGARHVHYMSDVAGKVVTILYRSHS